MHGELFCSDAGGFAKIGFGVFFKNNIVRRRFLQYDVSGENGKGRCMALQNVVAQTIDAAGQEAQYDACVKRLLSEKIILAWILKECVDEFGPYSVKKIMKDCIVGEPKISAAAVDQDEPDCTENGGYADETVEGRIAGGNTEDNSVKEGRVYYDIRFAAVVPDTKEPVQLIINVEAQKSDKTSYPLIKRAVFYGSRMILAQKNTVFVNSHYEKIRKVYSIWILMNVGKERANTITEYSITEKNIVGAFKEKESSYDLMAVIMIGLGKAQAADRPILRLLDILLSAETKPDAKKAILERDFDIPMTSAMREEANIMCNLGEGIREQAVQETQQKTWLRDVLNLMKSLNLSAEEAISALAIPEEERPSLLERIDEELAVK